MSNFKLPQLPYAYDSLDPHISAETMELHHSKHHQTYVTNLNNLLESSDLKGKSLEEIVKKSSGGLFNNAGQHWNHNLFWGILSPDGGDEPTGKLRDAINSAFGSLESFQAKFEQTGVTTFGSGWAWLVQADNGTLELLSTSNADNPLNNNKHALMGVDVWEHAYYVDYRNRRPDYLKAIWNIINWDNVADRMR